MNAFHRAVLAGATAGFFLTAAADARLQTPVPQEQPAPTDPAVPAAAESDAASLVTAATESWLALVDNGKYADSWTAAGQLFQANISQDQWAANMTTGRTPLGEVVKRELAERKAMDQVAGAPAGEYVVAAYFTDYAARAGLLETVTLVKENDTWKVIGYNIAPKPGGQQEAPQNPPADPIPAETPPPPPGN